MCFFFFLSKKPCVPWENALELGLSRFQLEVKVLPWLCVGVFISRALAEL